MPSPLAVWCNLPLDQPLRETLAAGVRHHRLLWAATISPGNVPLGAADARLTEADIAFGQPEGPQCAEAPRLRWIHLSSAGYAAFDSPRVRNALLEQKATLTTSSSVYAEPCAQHVLSFMLSEARQLPVAFKQQLGTRIWDKTTIRRTAFLLSGQTVLLVGFGSIARRLAALLAPFDLDLVAVRRRVGPAEGRVRIESVDALDQLLPQADHVVDLLPGSAETTGVFNEARFALMKPSAVFYNIGRGTTVDHRALERALTGGHLRAAYLDVTDPEPLPPTHPLWTTPHCVITPHTAGGHDAERARLVKHFLANLERFDAGQPLHDRVL